MRPTLTPAQGFSNWVSNLTVLSAVEQCQQQLTASAINQLLQGSENMGVHSVLSQGVMTTIRGDANKKDTHHVLIEMQMFHFEC